MKTSDVASWTSVVAPPHTTDRHEGFPVSYHDVCCRERSLLFVEGHNGFAFDGPSYRDLFAESIHIESMRWMAELDHGVVGRINNV